MATGKVKEALIEIHEKHGKLTPPIVVAEASHEQSPLHNEFEWNNDKAGYLYRLWQARALIRTVTINTVSDVDGKAREVHVIYHTHDESKSPVYHTRDVLIKNPMLLEEAERQALIKLNGARNSLSELQLMAEVEKLKKGKRYKKAGQHVEQAIVEMQMV